MVRPDTENGATRHGQWRDQTRNMVRHDTQWCDLTHNGGSRRAVESKANLTRRVQCPLARSSRATGLVWRRGGRAGGPTGRPAPTQ
eukprot:7128313-Alexandrium_andersonii.AAC.1